MTAAVYPKFREQLLSWAVHNTAPDNITFKVCGVDDDYVYSAAHNNLADLGSSIVITPTALATITVTNGRLDAADMVLSGVTPGPTLAGFVILMDWLVDTQLVCFIDESDDGSLPQLLNSTSFGLAWSAEGICQL